MTAAGADRRDDESGQRPCWFGKAWFLPLEDKDVSGTDVVSDDAIRLVSERPISRRSVSMAVTNRQMLRSARPGNKETAVAG